MELETRLQVVLAGVAEVLRAALTLDAASDLRSDAVVEIKIKVCLAGTP